MKLGAWRGVNVLMTDGAGTPVLAIDESGNVRECLRMPVALVDAPSRESLARSVAGWIEWNADEADEFPGENIHPDIRELVMELLAPSAIAA